MTDQQRAAMQAALEALESCGQQHQSDGGRQWYDDRLIEPAIELLRAALAEPDAGLAWKYAAVLERFVGSDQEGRAALDALYRLASKEKNHD